MLALVAGLILAAVVAIPAAAHVALATSDPADGATVAGAPELITLTFTEGVGANSFFNLKAEDGTTLGRGEPDPADTATMVLVPPALEPGAYRVEWSAVGSDGHIEKGRFTFAVEAPTPEPTVAPTATPEPTGTASPTAAPTDVPTASPDATAAPTPGPGDESPAASAGDALIPIVAGLVLLGGLAVFLLRRSRSG
jgi:copper resistance protein C